MPTLLRHRGYVFFFRSSDGGEPPHVHVIGNGGRAKMWLVPALRFADERGYDGRRHAQIERVTTAHRVEWLEDWARFFGR